MRSLSLPIAAVAAALCFAGSARAESIQPQANANLCLDFTNGSGQLADCNGSTGQEFDASDNDFLRVGKYCVASNGEGSPLIATKCRNRSAYIWTIGDDDTLENGEGLCADVQGGKIRRGQPVIGFRCTGRSNQRWAADDGGYDEPGNDDGGYYPGRGSTTSALSPNHARDLCLDFWHDGGAMIVHTCQGSTNQTFSYSYGGATRIEVEGVCLAAPGEGQQIYVQNCNNSRAQRWSFMRDGSIQSDSGLCFDVQGSRRKAGTFVVLVQCKGLPNQQWTPH